MSPSPDPAPGALWLSFLHHGVPSTSPSSGILTSSLPTFRQGSMHSHCSDTQKGLPLLAIPACLNHILSHHMSVIPARLYPRNCTQLLLLHCTLLCASTSERNPREMISQPSASFYHMLTADHFCDTTVFFISSDLGFTRK